MHSTACTPLCLPGARAPQPARSFPVLLGRARLGNRLRACGHRDAHSLLELLIALSLLGILLGLGVPAFQHARDRIAIVAARDAVAAAVARARALAPGLGGARLILDPLASTYWIESSAGRQLTTTVSLTDRYAVRLFVDGSRDGPTALWFDALGIGRLANRTIRFRRGGLEGGLTLSAYGRPRPW